jgi:hypothetical protein
MGPADRHVVRHFLVDTHRVWGWPADPTGEPGPFTGPKATMSDYRILTPGWRTGTVTNLDAVNDLVRLDRKQHLESAHRLYPNLPMAAPDGTPPPVAAAYEAVAVALVGACYFRLHVLPVAGQGDRSAWSDLTRQRPLELPWGTMSTEEAARQAVGDRDQARAAYSRAEVPLRAAVDSGGRCAFAEALGWIEGVGDVCESALAGQLPWDEAAAAIYTLRGVGPAQMLEEMRRQASRAALQMQGPGAGPYSVQAGSPGGRLLGPTGAAGSDRNRKGKRINERMLGRLQQDPASLYWSAQRWAQALGCSKSTIAGTQTWKETIRAAKARERAERELRQERHQGRSDED